ncbi:zinc finger and SCAN domain-containing protein 29-like, partial [Huso huso]
MANTDALIRALLHATAVQQAAIQVQQETNRLHAQQLEVTRQEIAVLKGRSDQSSTLSNVSSIRPSSYPHLKAEILAREGVSSAVRAQKYHAWGYSPGVPPRSQMYDLIHLATRWLKPEVNNAEKVIEILVIDRYLRSLPAPLRKWVGQGDPSTINEFVDLVEWQLAAEELSRQPQIPAVRNPRPPSWKIRSNLGSGKRPAMPERGEERPEV